MVKRRESLQGAVTRLVAARAAFRCSNPSCRRSTVGPHSDPGQFVSSGVAAHITAASPAGPRYDTTLSPEERHSIHNALWLCQTCHALVDNDPRRYSADLLRQWKVLAERIAVAALSTFQDANWPRDIKAQTQQLLVTCDEAVGASAKGRALETLVEVLFTSGDGLALADKRVAAGDEEIDLVCTNNVTRPFWQALGSPLLFIECKNWSGKVGAKEMRGFEIKLQNHGILAKIGFFVSINGFTSEVHTELKRMGRSSYHVVLIERRDIAEYLSEDLGLLNWLERLLSRLH